jgi:hypothetical protein
MKLVQNSQKQIEFSPCPRLLADRGSHWRHDQLVDGLFDCSHRVGGLGRQRWRHSFEWPQIGEKKGLVRVGVVNDFGAGRRGRESSFSVDGEFS